MANFCAQCGKPIDGGEICAECSARINPTVPAQAQSHPLNSEQNEKPVGTGAYFGLMLVFALPVLGFLICIITALAVKSKSIKNFAKAMLIWKIIGLILTAVIIGICVLFADVFMPYLNEITGGEISEMTEALGELSQIEEELKKIENSGVLENVTNGQKF